MHSISVVIPLFNKEKFIKRALESIYSQNVRAIEIIVVNDGSSDESAEIVRNHFPRVHLIEQENQGVSAARNAGIALAKGEFVAFLDADDYWSPNFIANIQHLLILSPDAGMLCTHYGFVVEGDVRVAKMKGVPSVPDCIPDLFVSCFNADLPITSSSVCIRRELLQTIDGFPIGMAMGEDQVVWAKIACLSKVMYHPDVSVYYDLTVEGSACDINHIFEPAPQLSVYQNILNDGLVPDHLSNSLTRLMHLTVLSCVINNLMANNIVKARSLLWSHPSLIWDKYRICGLFATYLPCKIISKTMNLIRANR